MSACGPPFTSGASFFVSFSLVDGPDVLVNRVFEDFAFDHLHALEMISERGEAHAEMVFGSVKHSRVGSYADSEPFFQATCGKAF